MEEKMDKVRPEKSRHVHRVDRPGKQLVGWSVRYQRGRERVSRFFADRAHGGPDGAHAAAMGFVSEREQDGDEVLALLRRLSPRKNSRFGIPGVTPGSLVTSLVAARSGWRTGMMRVGARCRRSSRF